jgi:hypothetical protein
MSHQCPAASFCLFVCLFVVLFLKYWDFELEAYGLASQPLYHLSHTSSLSYFEVSVSFVCSVHPTVAYMTGTHLHAQFFSIEMGCHEFFFFFFLPG